MADNAKGLDLTIAIGNATFQASGDSAVVMQALAEFRGLVELGPKPSGSDAASGKGEKKEPKDETREPLAVFVKRAWPSQASKATAIVMWAKQNESKTSLTPAEIEGYWRKTPGKAPANSSQVCANAQTKGWLHNEGAGKYSVTGHGEEMVKSTPMQS